MYMSLDKNIAQMLTTKTPFKNKRAHRALGRSPEEKVKGKRSQWSHLQRTTNIVHQILIEDL